MSEDTHKKAEALISTALVEGISETDRAWLDAHLEECVECASYAASVNRAVAALGSVTVSIRPELVEATRLRMRIRAQQLREERSRIRALWISCALSWILGAATAPLLWRGFEWAGRHLALPDLVWQAAFVLWWFVPAAIVGGALVWWRAGTPGENGIERFLPL
jgi:anti-sigma factor RsiW